MPRGNALPAPGAIRFTSGAQIERESVAPVPPRRPGEASVLYGEGDGSTISELGWNAHGGA